MLEKINQLREKTKIAEVKALCEKAINSISSAIYNNVSTDARLEIERFAIGNLFTELEKYTTHKVVNEWLANQKRIYYVKNLGVRKAVKTLIEKEARFNPTLAAILEDFKEKLEDKHEVLLYEGFISAMSSFNHLPAVNTELDAVAQRVAKYKNDVDITKIIETMKETRSNYLIPLIEDVVNNYLTSKTEQNKSFLKETLVKFSFDPFIRDIINIVSLDASQLQLEYNNAACGIEDKLFSPILYLGESEVLFNVKGVYYVKKGNNLVNKLKNVEIENINENFKNLCDVINLPNIEISKRDIKVYVDEDSAVLTEAETIVNGKSLKKEQINESVVAAKWKGNEEFFNIIQVLRENFNEIAELDFVKRVYLKENENHAADVFKLRDNIFITTYDPLHNKSTFYRNINPIQAEKIMMEHLRFDVSKTFADILPNKDKILFEIENTKREYSDYIAYVEDKISNFSCNYLNNTITNSTLEALVEQLDQVKNEYKDYLNRVEEYTSVAENLNITVQDDQSGKSYTVVVPTGAMAAKGEQGTGEIGADSTEAGTAVGVSSMPGVDSGGAASAVTFDDDQSELLSDQPSDEKDQVDLGADELEAYADKVDAETELEKPEEENGEEDSGAAPTEQTPAEEPAAAGSDELDLGDTGDKDAVEIEAPEDTKETEEENPEEENPEEGAGAPSKNLEKTNFNKEKNPNDLSPTKKVKKVYLKRPKK